MLWLMVGAWGADAESNFPDASHTDERVDEEVIVWANPFARFDDVRWLVKSEVIAPTAVQFGTAKRRLRVLAWQLETVVHCQVDSGGTRREVECLIEDAAVRAHVPDVRGSDSSHIRAMVRNLIGAEVELQVNAKGKVSSLGLDGMPNDNADERRVSDGVRTALRQLAAAFHMEVPDGNPLGASWTSSHEPLLEIVSPVAGLTRVNTAHRIDLFEGHWLQQTVGRATSTTQVPNPTAGTPCFRGDDNPRCPKMAFGQGILPLGDGALELPTDTLFVHDDPMPIFTEEPDYLDLEMRFTNELNAVSVIDPDRGYPIERVWHVQGTPAPTLRARNYWAAGSLQMLEDSERVKLGRSGMMSPPGTSSPHTMPWVDLNP